MELKNETRESFIFHAEYIADVPEELQPQYAMYAINYALKGIEPELADWRDIKMWNSIKNRIDSEAEAWIEAKKQRSESGKIGGQRSAEARRSKMKQNEAPLESASNERSETKQSEANEAVYVSVSEYVSESENGNEFVAPEAPIKESPPMQAYARKIFDIFHQSGLPCARGNFISFLQRDFRLGIGSLQSRYHSDDVIGACENYARTVNDPRSFITGKYSFDRFVTFKNFVDYLPANYNPENFIRNGPTGEDPPPKKKWERECPGCHVKALEWDNDKQTYRCRNCGKTYTFDEINQGG